MFGLTENIQARMERRVIKDRGTYRRLVSKGSLTEAESEQLADAMARLNLTSEDLNADLSALTKVAEASNTMEALAKDHSNLVRAVEAPTKEAEEADKAYVILRRQFAFKIFEAHQKVAESANIQSRNLNTISLIKRNTPRLWPTS